MAIMNSIFLILIIKIQFHILTQEKFSFCLSWDTNGWNFVKRDSIEYFNLIFKPLFLYFKETSNGTNDA